jgi:hypothetical protein
MGLILPVQKPGYFIFVEMHRSVYKVRFAQRYRPA